MHDPYDSTQQVRNRVQAPNAVMATFCTSYQDSLLFALLGLASVATARCSTPLQSLQGLVKHAQQPCQRSGSAFDGA